MLTLTIKLNNSSLSNEIMVDLTTIFIVLFPYALGLIGGYVLLKSGKLQEILAESINKSVKDMINEAIAEQVFEKEAINFTNNIMKSEDFQKQLYLIGGLIAKGAKDGFGIPNKAGGGKMDIGSIIMNLVMSRVPGLGQMVGSPQPQQQPQQQDSRGRLG